MTLTAVTTLGIGLSMDAFAASLGQGAAASKHQRITHACILAVLFGLAQAIMPLIGWSLGAAFHETFRWIDHWIAFVLLAFIGGAMIRAGLEDNDETPVVAHGWKLAALAIATSIDAAATGITLTLLGVPVWASCTIIGLITAILTFAGTMLGGAMGQRLGSTAEVMGGVVLIALGLKILIEHLYLT
jgi:putative Mn2+ efflux pump MntP